MEISFIIPVYKCGAILDKTVSAIRSELEKITKDYEIILVDDRYPDNAWEIITSMASKDKRIKGIRLSRNFGQEPAILAGASYAKGNYIFFMDCDLQENPKYIVEFYNYLKSGEADIVLSLAKKRNQNFFRKLFTKLYNFLYKHIGGSDFVMEFRSLMAFNKKVLKEFLKFKERHRMRIGILLWMGFKVKYVYLEHLEGLRKSSYSVMKLIEFAINTWVAHSTRLLYFSILCGFLFAILAIIGIIYVVIMYYTKGLLLGWPSLITSIFFTGSIISFQLGIIGLYLAKMFEQVKERPIFIIDETININTQ